VEVLVEFEVNVPEGIPESQVNDHNHAEAVAAAKLMDAYRLRSSRRTLIHPGLPLASAFPW
jgi:hypothetical protein